MRGRDFVPAMLAAAALLAAMPGVAFAQWTGKGEAGLAIATGNTETQSFNAKLEARHRREAWENRFGFSGVYAADEDETTAQRWDAAVESRYDISQRTFWYGALRYEDDRFSGFDYQGTASTGFGRRFIDSEETKFSAQLGVGYKRFATRDSFDPFVPGETDDAITLVGGIDWEHRLTDTTTVYDRFFFEAADANTYFKNVLGIAVKMTDRMALALALDVRHNKDPPAGFERTDTLTTVNLVYEVK